MVTLDGNRIVALRLQLGLTSQRALAEKTREVDPEGSGICKRLVWDAERGHHVSHRTHFLTAKALNVDPSELLPADVQQRAHDRRPDPEWLAIAVGTLIVLSILIAWAALRWQPAVSSPFPTRLPTTGWNNPRMLITTTDIAGRTEDYGLVISGSGFGPSPLPAPFYGTAPYFHVGDCTQQFEAGYSEDASKIEYVRWGNHAIVIDKLDVEPGDCLNVMVWNPQTHQGAAWGGNVPPIRRGTPRILSAHVRARKDEVDIVGLGFGAAAAALPFAENDDILRVLDGAYHPWGHGPSIPFDIGEKDNDTKLLIEHWSNTRIVVAGFTGAPLPYHAFTAPGDPIILIVRNPQNRLVTAWGGVAQ